MKSKFEEWFQQQPFYLNLRFIHGERLFIFDAQDGYVVQAVQISWATWQEQQKRIDELETHQEKQSECIKNLVSQRNSASSRVESSLILIEKFFDDQVQTPTPRQYANFIQEIYETLRGNDQTQEPQACDHTMVEKTQFGDLERSFECLFCDHKTTEAWVTKHE
ncbi:hypothetical protein LVY74_16715 [Acinetobacter sp. ME22]|uniref:hypothetical protein n=1 Tax=Acinetobacter sp. ME22 TaxID=2904802 RepID=UPI001EDACD96|nr:hypothetical protein [Acinetobacter sp. ME22]MCG2575181.1 hypothetical protein [Acinetobacter sp. ME22]